MPEDQTPRRMQQCITAPKWHAPVLGWVVMHALLLGLGWHTCSVLTHKQCVISRKMSMTSEVIRHVGNVQLVTRVSASKDGSI